MRRVQIAISNDNDLQFYDRISHYNGGIGEGNSGIESGGIINRPNPCEFFCKSQISEKFWD